MTTLYEYYHDYYDERTVIKMICFNVFNMFKIHDIQPSKRTEIYSTCKAFYHGYGYYE